MYKRWEKHVHLMGNAECSCAERENKKGDQVPDVCERKVPSSWSVHGRAVFLFISSSFLSCCVFDFVPCADQQVNPRMSAEARAVTMPTASQISEWPQSQINVGI
jgi:hypothetical protein